MAVEQIYENAVDTPGEKRIIKYVMLPSFAVVLSLGSNRPHAGLPPPAILRAACGRIGLRVWGLQSSSIYLTKPLYYGGQPDFYNLVCCGAFQAESPCGAEAGARELLRFTQSVEAAFGRDRSRETPKGPRSLDIDILLFGGERIQLAELVIPHPGITERAFVLEPLLEILPKSADPITGRKYADFRDSVKNQGVARLEGEKYGRI
ncbi:MAG: 2-amino-4-hydroxy-6-hydroxymethyldihydropteridine diphosphokinase [Treponema sp.]|jgi:2-amino-4-hydroxy-6-hydroxymethyldihydropteridine diphosphokinase|nr:2-amino-4-hydroxy-6-hydroxymethyldihydropteridine diphosphokinase [Treponema sp.]